MKTGLIDLIIKLWINYYRPSQVDFSMHVFMFVSLDRVHSMIGISYSFGDICLVPMRKNASFSFTKSPLKIFFVTEVRV